MTLVPGRPPPEGTRLDSSRRRGRPTQAMMGRVRWGELRVRRQRSGEAAQSTPAALRRACKPPKPRAQSSGLESRAADEGARGRGRGKRLSHRRWRRAGSASAPRRYGDAGVIRARGTVRRARGSRAPEPEWDPRAIWIACGRESCSCRATCALSGDPASGSSVARARNAAKALRRDHAHLVDRAR